MEQNGKGKKPFRHKVDVSAGQNNAKQVSAENNRGQNKKQVTAGNNRSQSKKQANAENSRNQNKKQTLAENDRGQNKKQTKRYNGKNTKGNRASLSKDMSSIRTIADNGYIPFGSIYDDDDIIPYDADYEAYSAPSRKSADSAKDDERGKNGRYTGKNDTDRRENEGVPGAVVGRNAVRELLKSGRSVDKLYVKTGVREGSIVVIVAEAVNKKIPIVEVSQDKLDTLAGGPHHQGVVALAAEKQYTDIETILNTAKERGETPLVVIADGIEDPQNLGALIRCAECAGAHGIIIPKRRAAGLTPIVTKASAGAIEHMHIAKVSNLADAVEKLKKAGLWIFAAEAGGTPYYETDFTIPSAIILGSEGFGVGKLLREKSDFTVSIPMYGKVNSLNVSTAASVILCHAARMQREGK